VNVAHRASVDRARHMRKRELSPLHRNLDDGRHVHVVEQHAATQPIAQSVDLWVGSDRPSEASKNKRGEREALTSAFSMLPQQAARSRHIHFEQTMHQVLPLAEAQSVEHEATLGWKSDSATAFTRSARGTRHQACVLANCRIDVGHQGPATS